MDFAAIGVIATVVIAGLALLYRIILGEWNFLDWWRKRRLKNEGTREYTRTVNNGSLDNLRAALDAGSELLTYFHTASGYLAEGFATGIGPSEETVSRFTNSLVRAAISTDSIGASESVGVVIGRLSVEAGNIFKLINGAQRTGYDSVAPDLKEARKTFGCLLVDLETHYGKLKFQTIE